MANSKLFVSLLLLIIGAFAHYQSFNLGLYGDDWLVIYLYFVPDGDPSRFGPLPGVLTHLTPYGPSIFLMGKLYELFGTDYYYYFMIALIFRVFASWGLFLALFQITKSKLISILVSILFLVGFTGIQTIDWVFYMNVYLAAAFFLMFIYFQFRFFETKKNQDLISQFIFFTLAVVTAPVRLTPLVLLAPLIELIMFFNQKNNDSKENKDFKIIVVKSLIFIAIISLLWLIGIFGGPGKIHASQYWSLKVIFDLVFKDFIFTINSFLYWIGITIFPDHLNFIQPKLIGFMFLILLVLGLLVSRKDRRQVNLVSIGGLIFFTFLSSMWLFSKFRLISSEDRYLLLPFASFCILLGIISAIFIKYYKKVTIIFLIFLIGLNLFATRSIYNYWLSIGRSIDFAKIVDRQIAKDFPSPVDSSKIIFLQSDNTAALHSLQFGLLFRITILSNTWNINYFNDIYNEKEELIKKVIMKIKSGESKQDVINSIYAYGYFDNKFVNITQQVREELSNISF